MIEELIIDEMTLDDLPEVLEIEKSSFPSPWSRQLFAEELEKEHSFNFVMRQEGRAGASVVGYIVFWKAADEMHILDFAVHPEFRRQAIATSLLDYALGIAKKEGCRHAFLEVRKSNNVGAGLYRSFGFAEIGKRKAYYKDGEDAIVMGLKMLEGQDGL